MCGMLAAVKQKRKAVFIKKEEVAMFIRSILSSSCVTHGSQKLRENVIHVRKRLIIGSIIHQVGVQDFLLNE